MEIEETPKRKNQLTEYLKQRILEEYSVHGNCPTKITRALRAKKYVLTTRKVGYFIKNYEMHGTIERRPSSGRPSKINNAGVLAVVQHAMEQNDETSGKDLKEIINAHLLGESGISVRSLQRARKKLGYKSRAVAYGQMIRAMNIEKRFIWATDMVKQINEGYDFRDRIFCDESKVVMEVHAKKNFVRIDQTTIKKPRPKYPYSVMIWGGISRRGKTNIEVFEGIVSATEYEKILVKAYLPFVQEIYADEECSLWQDNDPKHTSKHMRRFYEEKGVRWDPTPAESPDCNPIEFVWAELKAWLRNKWKPRNKDALIEGIKKWWDETLTIKKCNEYIDHLYKAFPLVVAMKGKPTGH